ncbi:hypothetical protein D9M68_159560 [compost metagenome]
MPRAVHVLLSENVVTRGAVEETLERLNRESVLILEGHIRRGIEAGNIRADVEPLAESHCLGDVWEERQAQRLADQHVLRIPDQGGGRTDVGRTGERQQIGDGIEARRHEQQAQQLQAETRQANQALIVKQGEITQLNKDGARLVAEIAASAKRSRVLETQAEQAHAGLNQVRVDQVRAEAERDALRSAV